MIPKSPCLHCEERHTGCHSKCDKYIDYRSDLDLYNAISRKNKEINRIVETYEADKCAKLRKKYGK